MKQYPSYIGVDQYGTVYPIGRRPPRKYLLAYFSRKHIAKMYIDVSKDGGGFTSKHVGYIVAGRWITLYTRMEQPA